MAASRSFQFARPVHTTHWRPQSLFKVPTCISTFSSVHVLFEPTAGPHIYQRPRNSALGLCGVTLASQALGWRNPRPMIFSCRASTSSNRQARGEGDTSQGQVAPESRSESSGTSLGVVITGGTKGLGYAMAREFLRSGDRVVVCGRTAHRVEAAVTALQQEFGRDRVWGTRCDVSVADDVEGLANLAQNQLGKVHIWINNAGEVTSKRLLDSIGSAEITRVVGSNVLGTLLCCREAIRVMRTQPQPLDGGPGYHIFNMGFSCWGAKFTKSSCTHKSTKMALTQLTESLTDDLREAGVPNIGVHNLSPGMVLTDLLLKDSTPIARRFFNTLAEEPETVARDVVPLIRATRGSNTSVEFLTPVGAIARVVSGFPQIIQGGRFFDKEGNRVPMEGDKYNENGVRLLYKEAESMNLESRPLS